MFSLFYCYRDNNENIIKKILKKGWSRSATHPDIYILNKSYIVIKKEGTQTKTITKTYTVYFKINKHGIKIYDDRYFRWRESTKNDRLLFKIDNSTVIITK